MKGKPALRILAILLMLTIIVPAAPVAAAPKPDTIYLGLGDSLAEGYGATDPARLGYVPRLYGFFHGAAHGGVNMYTNLGLGGETSTSFISQGQLAAALDIIDDSESTVGVVTFDIGSNDLLYLLTTEPCASDPTAPACFAAAVAAITTFGQNYTYILHTLTTHLAADSGHVNLLIMTYYNPWNGTGSPLEPVVNRVMFGSDGIMDCAANLNDPQRIGLNDVIKCVGQAYGATIADTYLLFQGKSAQLTHILEGDIHPNNAGYAKIADAFKAAYLHR